MSRSTSSYELQALLDAAVDAVILIDDRGRIEVFNRSAERLFGYVREEVLGRNVSMLMTDKDRLAHDGYMQRYMATGVAHIIGIGRQVDARRKDGTVFPAFLSVGQIPEADPPRFVGFIHDVTLREQAIAAMQRERDRANRYLEAAETILLALDMESRIKMINRKGCEVLAIEEHELLGRDWFEVAMRPEDRDAARAELARFLGGAADGPHYAEYAIRTASGTTRLVAWRCTALPNSLGSITGVLCSGDDITERRRAEERARESQERMTHVSRLATLGEMAAGIAHELNQPLAAIATYAQASERLLAGPAPELEDVREALQQIAGQALRAGEIIRRLRSLVKNRETERVPCDANELIEELAPLTTTDARLHSARLGFDLAAGLAPVLVDRVQIQQVLLNLLRNSIEAFDELDRAAPREIVISSRALEPRSIEITVCDTGPGVRPAIAERMFDPFHTTKAAGTGLGLAISRTIVEAHQGTLGYRPNVPVGACFYIRLPTVPGDIT